MTCRKSPHRDRIIAEHVDRDSETGVEHQKECRDASCGHAAALDPKKKRDQQEVFDSVIQNRGVTISFGLGKLYGKRKVRQTPVDLTVNKITDPPAAKYKTGRNRHHIQYRPKWDFVFQAKNRRPGGASKDQSVGCKSSDPNRGNQPQVFAIKLPFVVKDDDTPTADEDTDREQKGECVDGTQRNTERLTIPPDDDVHVKKPECEAETVPP